MSLLGSQVFANPTTPLWGGGGGGGGSNPTFQSVSFTPASTPVLSSELAPVNLYAPGGLGSILSVLDASSNFAPLTGSAFYAQGAGNAYNRVLYTATGIDYQQSNSGTSFFLAEVNSGSNGWDLSNVTSINGVPYFNSPGTQFDYRNYPGGSPLVDAPDWGVLNAISFTPPVNGKVYVESLGTYVALVAGGGVSMTFAVDGTNVSEAPTTINAYAGNTNLFGTSMLQFAVTANVTYDISSIAHCSAIPPSDPDVVVTSSRMFLLFSPN